MKFTTKCLATASVIALSLAGATSAAAGTSWDGFDVNAPRFQGWQVGFVNQPKVNGNQAQASISAIGADYTVDLRTAVTYSDDKGAIRSDVNEGNTVSLDTPFSTGKTVGLNLRTHTPTAVLVQVQGSFRSN